MFARKPALDHDRPERAPSGGATGSPLPEQAPAAIGDAQPMQAKAGPALGAQVLSHWAEGAQGAGGQALPRPVQAKMERSFGADLSDVRVHQGGAAQAAGAQAFTKGSDIHFAPGRYAPESAAGQRLLGHELAHVVQQRAGRVSGAQHKGGAAINDDPALEAEADAAGDRAAEGAPAAIAGGGAAPQATAAGPVQFYRQPDTSQPELRISDNERLAVGGKQQLYAHPDEIERSNSALATVGGPGGGAFLKLAASGDTIEGYPTLLGVKPVRSARQTSQTAGMGDTTYREGYIKENQSSPGYLSHSDCHLTAQTIMGSDDNLSGISDTEKPVLKEGFYSESGKPKETILPPAKSGTKNVANRGKDAFFLHALPRFAMLLQESVEEAKDSKSRLIEQYRGLVGAIREVDPSDEKAAERLAKIYRERILKVPLLAQMFANAFGVNEEARPEIGDALSQINDESEKAREDKKKDEEERREKLGTEKLDSKKLGEKLGTEKLGTEKKEEPEAKARDLWNFHWAGVIMKDADDFVTLENLSVEKPSENNASWYFKMYGVGKQSFHTENSKDSHVGESPLTLGFRTTEQPKYAPRKVVPLATSATKLRKDEIEFVTTLADEGKKLPDLATEQNPLPSIEYSLKGMAKKLGIVGDIESMEALRKLVVERARERGFIG